MNNPKYLKAWIVFFLIATTAGSLAGALAGGIAALFIGILNPGDTTVLASNKFLFQALGLLVTLPISFFVYKWSVKKFILPQLGTENPVD